MPSTPSDVQRKYIEMTYTVKNQQVMSNGRVSFLPDLVRVEHHFGEPHTVFVKGPIVRKNKTLGTQRAQVIFGRYGSPLNDCPDWVALLVVKFERMERAYA